MLSDIFGLPSQASDMCIVNRLMIGVIEKTSTSKSLPLLIHLLNMDANALLSTHRYERKERQMLNKICQFSEFCNNVKKTVASC